MRDLATRKDLVALVCERVEHRTESKDSPTLPANDAAKRLAPTRPWYDALFRYPSTLAW